MFKKLRNKLIFINLGITSLVVIIVFAIIYIICTRIAINRPPMPMDNTEKYTAETETAIEQSIIKEKKAAAESLLITLIVSGITIEIAVAAISYFLAEEAIKPIREAYDAQKIFIANASHEIKTPLAAISANLEAAGIHNNKWLQNVEKETTKLTALNSELLTLARTDLEQASITEVVDLNILIAKELESFTPRLKNTKLITSLKTTHKIPLHKADLLQIFDILMDNAIKYSNHKISIHVDDHSLAVANDGTTISKSDLPHIFERFYQADKSAEGVGLGLSIAKSLADRNHWVLTAESARGTTTFTLKW